MKITKFGHCCLLIEENGLRILTDPGVYSVGQDSVTNIDVILITHEHQDHFHIESVKKILKNNPKAIIITNGSVGKLLDAEKITHEIVDDGKRADVKSVSIEGIGKKHALIHRSIPQVENTGYFVAGKLFYPGDALTDPKRPVEILALPVAGPWLTIGQAIDYALKLKPKVCFPVHDGMLKESGAFHRLPKQILEAEGIKFVVIDLGQTVEF